MDTMGVPHTMSTCLMKNIVITGLDKEYEVELPQAYTKETIPASEKHIPTQEDLQSWPHLNEVVLPKINGTIDMLIGNNVADA